MQAMGYSIADNSHVLRWTKLELEPRTTINELDVLRELTKGLDLIRELQANKNSGITNDMPQHLAKNPEDIVRDYLSKDKRMVSIYEEQG
jgi:hypothetical protein